ncbi:MAG: hypothetical protein ABWZ66_05775 [Pyrinomonadaceae bacterium]
MKRSILAIIALAIIAMFTINSFGQVNAQGKLTMLRVHDVGTGFGPPSDFLNAEVIIMLDTQPGRSFGFQLRNDAQLPARQGMLDLLQLAFERNLTVSIDYLQAAGGKKNNFLFRTWLTK